MARICLDASLVLALLLPPERTPDVIDAWRALLAQDNELLAPPLLFIEVTSVLREQVAGQQITQTEADAAFTAFQQMPIERVWPAQLHARAWAIVRLLDQRKAYDAHYIAVAEIEACEFWTLDRKLANAVAQRLPNITIVVPTP